jgi:hypothetical protein
MHVTLFTVLQSSAPVNDRIISATSDTASTTLPVVQIYASTYWLQGETGATTEAFIDSFPAAAAPWQHPSQRLLSWATLMLSWAMQHTLQQCCWLVWPAWASHKPWTAPAAVVCNQQLWIYMHTYVYHGA